MLQNVDTHGNAVAKDGADNGPQVALIPGASGGIGRAVTKALADSGMHLCLGYHSSREVTEDLAETLRTKDRKVLVAKLDASIPGEIDTWVSRAIGELGTVHILANCMGLHTSPTKFVPFVDQDPADWRTILDLELLATMQLAQSALPAMIKQGYGRIVTVGSDSAKVGESGFAANTAARGGCNAFSKSLAREVGRNGITVNMVCPGPTDTPLLDNLVSNEAGQKMVSKMITMTAMKRVGTTQEVANAVAFLASPEAGYITGQALSVSGGLTMC